MPTRRGWLWIGASVVLATVGRILGLVELYVVATAGVVLVAAAVTWVSVGRANLVGTRSLHPPRAHVDQPCRAELEVRNRGTRRSPLMMAHDPFDGGRRTARFLLASLEPGELGRAAYRLPSERRGVFAVGPLELERRDPFALASSSTAAADPSSLIVYPRVEVIAAPPQGRGDHIRAGRPRSFVGQRGEDFYTLRPYDLGDDLRRVHWPSTARVDDLLVRQEETPWQGGIAVAVDLRRRAQTATTIEAALSAAASVATAAIRAGAPVRLVTSAGVDTGSRSGPAHLDAMLTRLAEASVGDQDDLRATMAMLCGQRVGGTLVMVTTTAAPEPDLVEMAKMRSWFGLVILVLIEDQAPPRGQGWPSPAVPGELVTVRVGAGAPFSQAWAQVVTNRRPLARR